MIELDVCVERNGMMVPVGMTCVGKILRLRLRMTQKE